MPCWYFERKEIKYSPSFNDGIDTVVENRYRREGARFIIDAGTRMGLRNDTCATGVVYFHRFYMFHSFKDFYRYVTAACCLLLAGKVEETPKKCKDIIKITQSLLSASSFARFGEDPREEVMTMERALLKTIKFDFQVDHPYSCMLKYAKLFKGEKEKTQKMVQMAWTFINDSLCTTLCLQWESEIVAVSLMYLASRLTKYDPSDWSGRTSSRSKWWEDIIEGMSMELMEDVCHQVLDLYSSKQKKTEVDSPPQSPAKGKQQQSSPPPPPPPDRTPNKRVRETTPSESERPQKSSKMEEGSHISTIQAKPAGGPPIPPSQQQHIPSTVPSSGIYSSIPADPSTEANSGGVESGRRTGADYNAYNPYVSSQMFSSSFMSHEGAQNIQSILAGNPAGSNSAATSSCVGAAGAPQHYPHQQMQHGDMMSQQQQHYPRSADQQFGYNPSPGVIAPPGSGSLVDKTNSNYSYPPSHHYGVPPSSTASHNYQPSTTGTTAAPSTFDPYQAPPPSNPSAYPYRPQASGQPPSYPPPSMHHYPVTTVPNPYMQHQSQQPSNMSSYSNYPQQPGYAGMAGNMAGAQSMHRTGSYHNQRRDIPSLTDIKIAPRPEWGHK